MRIFQVLALCLIAWCFGSFAHAADCQNFIDSGTVTCPCTGKAWNVQVLKTCRLGETCENSEYSLLGRYCGTDPKTHQNCYLPTISYSCIVPPLHVSLRQAWSPALIDKLSFEEATSAERPLNSTNAVKSPTLSPDKK